MNLTCFFRPHEKNGCFSNWYLSNFEYDGVIYTSMEQYMMHQKALLFNDPVAAEKIITTHDVAAIKKLGRTVQNFNAATWDLHKCDIVTNGLFAKFSQNEKLRKLLLDTGDTMLVECSPYDKIWGCGFSVYDSNRLDEIKWTGENLLGKCLVEARTRIKTALEFKPCHYLKKPYTVFEIVDLADDNSMLTGNVAVSLSDMINSDVEEFNDLICEKLVGDYLLSGIYYEPISVLDNGMIVLSITADVSDILDTLEE